MTLGEGDTEFAREGKQTPRGPVSHLHVAVGNLYHLPEDMAVLQPPHYPWPVAGH